MAADRPLSKHSAPPIGRKQIHIEPSLSLSLREEGSWKVIRREDRERRKGEERGAWERAAPRGVQAAV